MKNSARFEVLYAFLFLAVLAPSICLAWSGKVVSVTDGDTIKVLHDGKEEVIRLYGVDSPEKKQSFGQKARDFTTSLVAGKTVEVEPRNTDRYKRTVAVVSVDGQNVNELTVRNGYAWVYRKYCKESFCLSWKEKERSAKESKIGMWSDSHIIPPWEFRHSGKIHLTTLQPSNTDAVRPDIPQ